MNELSMILNKEVKMSSLELCNLINTFRAEEGKKAELTHFNFLQSIKKEVETLENVGISTKLNFQLSSYESGNRNYTMYILNKRQY